MRFKLYTYSNPGGIAALTSILLGLVKPPVSVECADGHNGLTGEVSLLDIFEASRAYRERFGEKAETMEEHSYPTVTASTRVGPHRALEFKVISQVIRGGVSLHLYLYGERGCLELVIERSDWSSRAAGGEMITTAEFYGKDAAGDPARVDGREGFASELFALWQAKEDEGLAGRMVELYNELTPPMPPPALVAYWGDDPLRLRNWAVESGADAQRYAHVPRGVYELRAAEDGNRADGLLVLVGEGLGEKTGMGLIAWRRLARERFPFLELIYRRTKFSHRDPALEETFEQITSDARRRHDGKPFEVLSVTHNEGYITGYRVRFEDGFETDADRGEVEFRPYAPEDEEAAAQLTHA